MSIFNLLDELESTIDNSKRAFMQSDKAVIAPEELFVIIDKIRTTLPEDIRDAQWVKKEEEQIKRKAQEDYERILKEGKLRADALASETEIMRLAESKAKQMLDEAHQAAQEIMLGGFHYANDIMEKIEKQLQIYYDVVQDGKDEIRKSIEAIAGQE